MDKSFYKISLTLALVIIIFIGATKPIYKENYVTFNKSKIDDTCGSCFQISKSIEKNPKWRSNMSKYLFISFIDFNDTCIIDEGLFVQESFTKIVLYIYDSKEFLDYSIYDNKERWRERYIYLITNCPNDEIVYVLCDSLLSRNIDDGLRVMWNKDVSNLNCLDYYSSINTNYHSLAMLATVYHNSGLYRERNRIMEKVMIDNEIVFNQLHDMFDKQETIDYFDYMELIYGGI